jgi:hypothetical protein
MESSKGSLSIGRGMAGEAIRDWYTGSRGCQSMELFFEWDYPKVVDLESHLQLVQYQVPPQNLRSCLRENPIPSLARYCRYQAWPMIGLYKAFQRHIEVVCCSLASMGGLGLRSLLDVLAERKF